LSGVISLANLVTNTPSDPTVSTAQVSGAAPALDGEQRPRLALPVLTRSESVTELAEPHQVSRKFLYQPADQGEQALEHVFQSPAPMDDDALFYLPVPRAWLRQVVLGRVLLGHRSFRGVIACFRDLLDQPIALGTVHTIVQEAVVEARRINATQDLSRVRSGSHDERFQGHQPVLVGIDLDSTDCYLLALEAHRDAETWAIHR